MNKEDIYEFIKNKNIWYEITEHEAVLSMEGLSKIVLPYPEDIAKNLFICDDKKQNYYLITVKDNKRVNLKEFRKNNKLRPLSFAPIDDLNSILQLAIGSVTPFGLLNDKEIKVTFYLDKDFIGNNGIIGIHPNDNTATVWLKVNDLIDIIEEHGNNVYILEI